LPVRKFVKKHFSMFYHCITVEKNSGRGLDDK